MNNILKLSSVAVCLSLASISIPAIAQQTPPCTMTIDSQEAFDQWKSVDINNDGETHQFLFKTSNGGKAYYEANPEQGADDWLISPAVTLSAGQAYRITLSYRTYNSTIVMTQEFSMSYGPNQAPEGMQQIYQNHKAFQTSLSDQTASASLQPETSGEYYIGIHVNGDSRIVDFSVTSVEVEAKEMWPGEVSDLKIEAGPKGAMYAGLTWTWPTKNNCGLAQEKLTGAKIYRSTDSKCEITEGNLIYTMTGEYQPGTTETHEDRSITEAGKYYYRIIPTDTHGDAHDGQVVKSGWIGEDDSPDKPANVAATVGDDLQTVTITWDAPTEGDHGGYIDPSELTYRIKRYTNNKLDEENNGVLADNLKTTTYTDVTEPGHRFHKYKVYACYKGEYGSSGESDEVEVGKFTLPYFNNFAGYNPLSQWTMFNAGYGRWELYGDLFNWSLSLDINYFDPVDAYAALPPLDFEEGKAYEISFSVRSDILANSSLTNKTLEVLMGKDPTIEGLGKSMYRSEITNYEYNSVSLKFNVDESGKYYLAFRGVSEVTSFRLCVYNVGVKEIQVVPMPVTNANVTPGEKGSQKARINWDNPADDTGGNRIESISKVEIYRDDTLIAEETSAFPGRSSFYDDNLPEPGIYTYKLIPYIGDNAGEAVEIKSSWIGHDTPATPESISPEMCDDGQRLITFSEVTDSEHGGYMTLPLSYNIYRNGSLIAENITSSPYYDQEEGLSYDYYRYEVTAVSNGHESEPKGKGLRYGEPLTLPYLPDFSDEHSTKSWTFESMSAGSWSYNPDKEALQVITLNCWAFTPPFKAEEDELKVTVVLTKGDEWINDRHLWLYLVKDTEIPAYRQTVSRKDSGESTDGDNEEFTPILVGTYLLDQDWDVYGHPWKKTVEIPKPDTYRLAFGTLELPKCYIYLHDVKVRNGSDTSTGVVEIEDEPSETANDVYNLQGLLLKRNATRDDIKSLTPGLYIIGGKKVMVNR